MHHITIRIRSITLSILLIFLATGIHAQTDTTGLGNNLRIDRYSNAPDSLLPDYSNLVANNRTEWSEVSVSRYHIVYAGPGFYYDPALFQTLSQYTMIFLTGIETPIDMEIRYDDGVWNQLDWYYYSDLGQIGSEQIEQPWSETGAYTIDFRWMTVDGEWQNQAEALRW